MRLTATVCTILLLAARSAFASPDDTPGAPAAAPGNAPPAAGAADPGAGGVAVPPPGTAGVCAGVTCAGHGNCVEYKGSPTCACAEGYMPDTVNGLNCLPFSPAALVARPPAWPPVEKVPLSEQARVERAIDGRYLGNEYQLYLSEAAGQISFAQYMWEDTQRRRKGFSGCAIIGGLFIAGGAALYVTSFMKLTEDGDDLFLPLLMSAIGCAALGGVLLGVGAHGARHEKRNREKLEVLLFEERNGRPIARSWAVSPFATVGGAGLMAAIEL